MERQARLDEAIRKGETTKTIRCGAVRNDGFFKLRRVMEQVKAPDNVLVFTKATKEFIGIGSTRTSMAKYWVGFGVLETSKDGRLQPRILTPSQYERSTKQHPVSVPVSLLNGRNFEQILVFDTVLDFRR